MPEQTKGRILCTEDDADTRELLTLILRAEGFEILCADTPEDALRLAKTETFDLFLVDNWMPGMSGPQLTERLRQFNVKTPILFTPALDSKRTKTTHVRQGHRDTWLSQPKWMS